MDVEEPEYFVTKECTECSDAPTLDLLHLYLHVIYLLRTTSSRRMTKRELLWAATAMRDAARSHKKSATKYQAAIASLTQLVAEPQLILDAMVVEGYIKLA